MISRIYNASKALLTRKVRFEIDLIPFQFEDLPLKKIVNWVLTEGSVLFKPARPWGFPTILQVEPTNHCNVRCRICPVTTGMDRASGHMDPGLFKKIVDEMSDYLLLILFWDWGEPFLNPSAYDMIRYARSRGIKVMSSTNGHIFAAGEHAADVVRSGLDVLVFSVDGITQETYQLYRNTGKLALALEGIKRVVEQKRVQGSKTPLVNFRFIVMKHNEQEIPLLTEFARSLGAEVLTIRKFHSVPGLWPEDDARESSLIPGRAEYQLPRRGGEDQLPVRIGKNPCKNLWNCPTVHWDGTVCSCFMDYREERPLGLLKSRSFRDIWYGQALRNLRTDFRKSWQDLPLCGQCSCGFKGGDVGRESNAEAIFFS